MTTLERYILSEIFTPYMLSLTISLLILTTGRMVQIAKYIFQTSVTFYDFILLVLFSLPRLSFYAIPMATILGITLAINRLNSDREIIAIQSTGINIKRLWKPFLIFTVVNTLLVFSIAMTILPTANMLFRKQLSRIGASSVTAIFQEGVFIDLIPGLIIYFKTIKPKELTAEGVYIEDFRDSSINLTVIAKSATIHYEPSRQALVFLLKGGSMTRFSKKETAQIITFDSYLVEVFLGTLFTRSTPGSSIKWEMSMAELYNAMKTANTTEEKSRYGIEFYHRIFMPLNCIIFGMLAVPICAKMKKNSLNILASLLIFLAYYILSTLAKGLSENGIITPFWAVVFPSLLFILITLMAWKHKRLS